MSSISIQQLPKDVNFLRCFVARPGHVLVYSDIAALEPHVMAHFSQDPGLMSIYGLGAKPNDVYLYTGSKISKWKDKILQYYDPDNPSAASIEAAKEGAKAERAAVKPIYLGWLYYLGAHTMHENTGIPLEECQDILRDIDEAYSGVGAWRERLKRKWESTGGWVKYRWEEDPETGRKRPIFVSGRPGWIIGGRGRPLAVAPDKLKDLGNRFVQTTGHDVLLQLLVIINRLRKERVIHMRPYNVDVHDATVWEVVRYQAEEAAQVIRDAYTELNSILRWSVRIHGEVKTGEDLSICL